MKKKTKYITKPIVDKGPKYTYWKVRFTETWPLIDNYHTTGTVGTKFCYIITKYLKFDEPKSKWFITKLFRDRNFYKVEMGYVLPVNVSVVSIDNISKEVYKDGVYFKTDDYTDYLLSPNLTQDRLTNMGKLDFIDIKLAPPMQSLVSACNI